MRSKSISGFKKACLVSSAIYLSLLFLMAGYASAVSTKTSYEYLTKEDCEEAGFRWDNGFCYSGSDRITSTPHSDSTYVSDTEDLDTSANDLPRHGGSGENENPCNEDAQATMSHARSTSRSTTSSHARSNNQTAPRSDQSNSHSSNDDRVTSGSSGTTSSDSSVTNDEPCDQPGGSTTIPTKTATNSYGVTQAEVASTCKGLNTGMTNIQDVKNDLEKTNAFGVFNTLIAKATSYLASYTQIMSTLKCSGSTTPVPSDLTLKNGCSELTTLKARAQSDLKTLNMPDFLVSKWKATTENGLNSMLAELSCSDVL